MMDMMRACWQCMMSLGAVLLVGMIVAIVQLIVRLAGKVSGASSR